MPHEPLIRVSDFNSIRVEISVTNTTRNSPIDQPDFKIQFLEFTDDGLVLELPTSSVQKGHFVTLRIDWTDAEENQGMFHSGGKVLDFEKGRAAIQLLEYDEASWEKFQSLYSSRQDEILKFFSAVRGE